MAEIYSYLSMNIVETFRMRSGDPFEVFLRPKSVLMLVKQISIKSQKTGKENQYALCINGDILTP